MGKIRQFFGLGPSRREQREAELSQWERIQDLMFLKLLQEMCETYKKLKFNSWCHDFGGWNPGPVVRAYNTHPTEPIFAIHRETRRTPPNYYDIEIKVFHPEFKTIYRELLFVKDAHKPYIEAVIDLVRFGSNGISSETQQNLQKLKNITNGQVTWGYFHEAAAIWHLQQLQKHR